MATYDLTSNIPSNIQTGDILNCPYSGTYKQITLPKGTYKLEVWGAEGGHNPSYSYGTSYREGVGGYSYGVITLSGSTILYLYAGGAGTSGTSPSGGFNGGGNGCSSTGRITTSGGGASDIRIGQNSLYARVIVAGGGGGGRDAGSQGYTSTYYRGAGGGTTAYQGGYYSSGSISVSTSNFGRGGGGGGQTSAGATGTINNSETLYSAGFGTGGYCGSSSRYGEGGGGGWYGGGAGSADADGGGGSGYIYTSSTASNYPSGCLLNSSYYLTSASTVAGNTSFTSPTGSTETGHSGNGYIRITVQSRVEEEKTYAAYVKINSVWKGIKRIYIKLPSQLPSGYKQLDYLQSTGTQWIDSGLTVTENTWIDTELSYSASYEYNMMIGSWNCLNLSIRENNYGCISVGGVSLQPYLTFKLNKKYRIILGPDYGISINSEYYSVGNSTNTTGTTNHLLLFGCNDINNGNNPYNWGGANGYSQGKIYSCKFYTGKTNDSDASTLTRNFIPAKRISDNVLGMYDLVSNTFFTNSGTGTFTAGPEIDGTWTQFSAKTYEDAWSISNIATSNFYGIYYANNLWVAGSYNSSTGLYYSTDGENWTRSNITSGNFYGIYYANNLWVAGSYNSSTGLYYSTDGKTWVQSNITSDNFYGIYYANNLWVAGNYSSKGIYYSTDGKTWVQSNITSNSFTQVYYGNIWVASGSTSGLYYSTDGKTWTQSNITSDFINDILYVSTLSIWVANGDAGTYYSSNGTSWNTTVLGYKATCPGHSLVYGQNKIVLGNKAGLWYSTNGINWNQSNITSGNYYHIWYANNVWMAAEQSNNQGIVTSNDGITWKKDVTSGNWNNIYYGNGKWVAASNSSKGLWFKEE